MGDNTLELLIKLGVIGKEDAAAVNDLLRETKEQAEGMNASVPENLRGMEKQAEAAKKMGESAKMSGIEHRALHSALDKLNELIPGLGSTIALLTHGYMEAGEAAEGATAANEGFLMSLGPLAILVLSIQAVVKYVEIFKEKSEEAQKAQTELWKANDEASRKALESMEEYVKALAKARGADDDYRAGLTQDNAVLEAQIGVQKNILKSLEANELAQAKSEEAKHFIKQKYADLDANLDTKSNEGKIKNAQQAIERIKSDEKEKLSAKEGLEDQRNLASREYGASDRRARMYDKQIEDLQSEIVKMEEEKRRLTTNIGNMGQVNSVVTQGNINQAIVQEDMPQAAKFIADKITAGGTVPTDQRTFMIEFADEMAHRLGALRPNQDFSNAQAAATFMENFIKNQPNAYERLFYQVEKSIIAARDGQDNLAAAMLRRFEQLEAQLRARPNLGISG